MQPLNCATLVFVCMGMAGAAEFFPIAPGNMWVYRAGERAPLTVEVGRIPLSLNGRVYHQLSGYAVKPLWVRSEATAIYYLDQATGAEALLVNFEPSETEWFAAPGRECRQEGRALPKRAASSVPAGSYESALVVAYRVFDCADAGVLEEQFVANVGMVRRTVETVAGPATYELVSARAGSVAALPSPNTYFSVALRQTAPNRMTADLRLSVAGGQPVELTFPSSQEYEVVLRDAAGKELWRWSDGRAFLTVIVQKPVFDLAASVEVPLDSLAPGAYSIDAWLPSTPGPPRFAASAPFRISPEMKVEAGQRTIGRPAGRLRENL
jgi:hypothetical protein